METMTEVGKILHELGYIDSQVERFDKLAMHLYSIPLTERWDLISVLMWYCGVMKEDGTVREPYKHLVEHCDELYAQSNK